VTRSSTRRVAYDDNTEMPSAPLSGCIRGKLVLAGPLPATSSCATVSLIDATYTDEPATVLARVVLRVASLVSGTIDFCLGALPHRPARRRWLFDAVVTADCDGQLRAGDYVLDYAVEYPEQPDRSPVLLNLKRIN
jgi:hypothetical protein